VLGGEEVLAHRRALHQADVLEGAADPQRGPLVHRQGGDVLALEQHAARGRLVEAGDHVERRRLAGAVRADDADDLPLAELDADVARRLDAAEADGEAPGLKHGHR
jgi:hypothetical protein